MAESLALMSDIVRSRLPLQPPPLPPPPTHTHTERHLILGALYLAPFWCSAFQIETLNPD